MVSDSNVINEDKGPPASGDPQAAPQQQATPAATRARSWSVPSVSRKQVDDLGGVVVTAVTTVVKALAEVARYSARVATTMWRALDAVPPALRVLFVLAVLMLLGIVGSIALSGTARLLCAIVVVPVSSVTLGALGHRWLTRNGAERQAAQEHSVEPSEFERSIVYVDNKLTLALNSFGTERHQQAVIALFQAKTAVELALGTEAAASHIDEPVSVDDYGLRPRIQPGLSKSPTPESTSLAAS
ncbi:hypothetical protein [Mycolicibacterium iranicum]|uniref:hypothetical protein n=1 Tax=Mycolicibacterium iranicum TaxID=912594 RepID=UPI000AE876BF|nr:hypothetical protein [Mycolicibacterium iranicum]